MGGMTIEERFQHAVESAARSNFRVERRMERILHDDVPTFMEAPPYGEASNPDIVVVGVPFEGIKIKDPPAWKSPRVWPVRRERHEARNGAGALRPYPASVRKHLYARVLKLIYARAIFQAW